MMAQCAESGGCEMEFGIASVAAITVICYLAGVIAKATTLDNKWIPVICGVLGGVLGVMFVRPAVIATTSISAGTATVSSVMGLLGYRNDTVTWALMAVLSAVFILFQLKNAKD